MLKFVTKVGVGAVVTQGWDGHTVGCLQGQHAMQSV